MEKKKKNNSLFKYDLERHSSHSKVFLQHKLGKILPFCDPHKFSFGKNNILLEFSSSELICDSISEGDNII